MNRNLESYIFKIEGFLTSQECKDGIKELEENSEKWEEHQFYILGTCHLNFYKVL